MATTTVNVTHASIVVTPQATLDVQETFTAGLWAKICFWRGLRRGALNNEPVISV